MKENVLEDVFVYEVGFHLLSTVPEEKLETVVAELQNLITKNNGTIISEEFPKLKTLAYEIKKRIGVKYQIFNKAYFGWIKFEATTPSVVKINEGIKINENVLRFIIVKTIRENTMSVIKVSTQEKESKEPKSIPTVENPSEAKVKISEEELDKSIDDLIVEN